MSYDSSQLATSALFRVRLAVGDTDTNRHFLDDDEINYIIAAAGDNEAMAAVDAAERILAELAKEYSRNTGSTSNSRDQKFDHYERLLERLRTKVGSQAAVQATGLSKSEVDGILDDSDFIKPSFEVGMHDRDGTYQHPNRDEDC